MTPERLAELLRMIEREEISQNAARDIFPRMFDSERSAAKWSRLTA